MKRLLIAFIVLLVSNYSFGQSLPGQRYVVKVQGQPGIYGLANNSTKDSLIFWVQGVRHAIPMISGAGIFYTMTQIDSISTQIRSEITASSGGGVFSYNGRTGTVTPQAGDYGSFYYPLSGNPSGFLTPSSITGKLNASDTTAMLSPYATNVKVKADSTTLKNAIDSKQPIGTYATGTGSASGTNTGDQDLSGLVPKTTTVNGKSLSSNITLVKADVGLGNVDNTPDISKPISTATQNALNLKANIDNPTFTGTVNLSDLNIYGASKSTITVRRSGVPSSTSMWDYTSGTMQFGTTGADGFNFITNGVTRASLSANSGIMVIGTSTNLGGLTLNIAQDTPTLGIGSISSIAITSPGSTRVLNVGIYGSNGASYLQTRRTVDNNATFNLLLNPLGGNVAIGKLSANEALDVFGNIKTSGNFIKSGGTSSQFLKADGSVDANSYLTSASITGKVNVSDTSSMLSPYIRTAVANATYKAINWFPDTTNAITGLTTNYQLGLKVSSQWVTNGSNISYIGGNVGIGTTLPLDLFHVSKDQNASTRFVVGNPNAGAAASAEIVVSNNDAISSNTLVSRSLRVMALGTAYTTVGGFVQNSGILNADVNLTGGLSIMTRANAPIRFYTNGHTNERMRINNDGNVGIGTPTPAEKIDVVGNGKISGTVTASSFIKSGGTSSQFLKADGSVDANSYLTSASITGKMNVSDTASMLSPYIRTAVANATYEPKFTKNTAFNKNFDITAGTVMEGKRAIDSLALINTRIKNLDGGYITTGTISKDRVPTTNLYANDGIKADTTTNIGAITLGLKDSVGIGGLATNNGLTVYSQDKTAHTNFGGQNGRSIEASEPLELRSTVLFMGSTQVAPGYGLKFLWDDYSTSYDMWMNSAQELNIAFNGLEIVKIDTTGHFTPSSLNKSDDQYNSGGSVITANIDQNNMVTILNQTTALTIANPTGRPKNGQSLLYEIFDNGTAQTITWGTNFSFDSVEAPKPTTTIPGKYIYVDLIWNTNSGKYIALSVKARQ